ncbi:MAG: hypothetical protein ACK56F_03545 [bacterium]
MQLVHLVADPEQVRQFEEHGEQILDREDRVAKVPAGQVVMHLDW